MSLIERRSGRDIRPQSEKDMVGERRSGVDRRLRFGEADGQMPSIEQLAAFGRRIKRAIRDEKGRTFFGVATEDQFSIFPDVLRLVEWIDHTTKSVEEAAAAKPMLRKAILG